MADASAIPVTLLTGFLGSGKTTLLNALLADPALSDTAVIVNEFGDISVDHDLVRVGEQEMMVTTTGCLCCTVGSDIRSSLFELLQASRAGVGRPFSRVIVETTGLADLAPVVNQIVPGGAPAIDVRDHDVAHAFRLAGVVCTVDIVTAEATIERYFECLKQIAFADRLVLTKTDMARDPASRHDVDELLGQMRAINPSGTIYDRNAPAFDIAVLFAPRDYVPRDLGPDIEGWLSLEQAVSSDEAREQQKVSLSRHGNGGIQTFSLTADHPIMLQNLDSFLSVMGMMAGAKLLRLKGLVCLEDDPERPVVVHCVQHAVHPPKRLDAWPSDDRRTRLVAISHDIDPKAVRNLFSAITGEKRPMRLPLAAAAIALAAAIGLLIAGISWTAQSQASDETAGGAGVTSQTNAPDR